MRNLIYQLSKYSDFGLSLLRIMMGIVMTYHGFMKVFHGGYAVGFFGALGLPIPFVLGPLVSLWELLGGLCLIAGLFTRYAGVIFFIEFVVVVLVRVFLMGKGYAGTELELMVLLTALLLATNGGGSLAVDRVFRGEQV